MSDGAGLMRDTPLARTLKDIIRRDGAMPIATYMSHCHWDPAHGYYASKPVIGRDGDFITASEISQTFGELIGLWSAVVWQQVLSAPSALTLVEYGPGRGTLMRDALRATRVVPGFQAATRVHLVEMSETFREAQTALLANAGVPITWGQSLAGFAAPAIIIANEFLDSWPASQWIKTPQGWGERAIGLDANGDLTFTILDSVSQNANIDRDYPDAQPGSVVEMLDYARFARALRAIASQGPLAALIIDYGHTLGSSGDTLQALRGHAYESPLASPGEADLTTHVNFFALATALHGVGLALDGPVTQTEFLGSLGIIERASRLMAANPARSGEIEAGVARLLAPNGMGTRFKVLGVRSADLPALPGFFAAT